MALTQTHCAILAGAIAAALLPVCSPDPGGAGKGPLSNGFGGGPSQDASLGTGSTGAIGEGGGAPVFNPQTPVIISTGPDSSCAAISQIPEQTIVYHDATVTDTIYTTLIDTYVDTITTEVPVALIVMQDRTGSMVSGFPAGSPQSWNNSTVALDAFVRDPASAGLDLGLAFFPPVNSGGLCDGSDCATLVVPVQPIGQTAGPIATAMAGATPFPLQITPLECGIRGMIRACQSFMALSPTGEKCVAIFVSDGNAADPTQCDPNVANLVNVISQGLAAGVQTYALGLAPGATLDFLNQIAQAGGTGQAYDVTGGTQAFIAALASIRERVTTTASSTSSSTVPSVVSSQVTTQTVVSTKLDCQWKIPAPPPGEEFDPAMVNLQLTPVSGPSTQFGHVPSEADCSRAGDGWYYDNPQTPTEVFVCPQTCATLKATTGARIDILLHCATVPAILQ